jgi:hypothetical protein
MLGGEDVVSGGYRRKIPGQEFFDTIDRWSNCIRQILPLLQLVGLHCRVGRATSSNVGRLFEPIDERRELNLSCLSVDQMRPNIDLMKPISEHLLRRNSLPLASAGHKRNRLCV